MLTSNTVEQVQLQTPRPPFISPTSRKTLVVQGSSSASRRPQAEPGQQIHRRGYLPSLAVYYSLKVVIVPQSINTGYAYRKQVAVSAFPLSRDRRETSTEKPTQRDPDSNRMHSCWHVRKRGNQEKFVHKKRRRAWCCPSSFGANVPLALGLPCACSDRSVSSPIVAQMALLWCLVGLPSKS